MRFVWLLLLLLVSSQAQAQSPQDLFAKGDYGAAAVAARALGSAEGDGLAARATLTRAAYFTADRTMAEALIDIALVDARRGQGRDAKALEPLLQEGVALGYRAKLQQSPKVARLAKAIFDKAYALDPENTFAAMSIAAWNGEPIADLGGFLSRTLLGATQNQALKYYEQALKLDPQNPVLPIFYGFNIYRMDDEKHGDKAKALLETAVTLDAPDAFGAMLQKSARDVLATMQVSNVKATKKLIRQRQPFGQILVKK
jgi:tetratricopeptide (TPR) repeat protein